MYKRDKKKVNLGDIHSRRMYDKSEAPSFAPGLGAIQHVYMRIQ